MEFIPKISVKKGSNMENKKVIAFIGSPRKGETYRVVQDFEKSLKIHGDIDFEYVFLKDADLRICKGCFSCLFKGEEYCPLKDDRDLLLQKIENSDGIIFATPNYALQVTAIMKNFVDRLAFVFHRPRYFHKTFMGIVTQGAYGGNEIVAYLENLAKFWGFNIAKGFHVTTVTPRTTTEQKVITKKTVEAARRFYKALMDKKSYSPSLFQFAIFRMIRSMYQAVPDEESKDYCYFRDQGWFTSDYYYPVSIGVIKKLLGKLIDGMGRKMAIRRNKELQGR
jgi:multimeric flavodoxin WrbA